VAAAHASKWGGIIRDPGQSPSGSRYRVPPDRFELPYVTYYPPLFGFKWPLRPKAPIDWIEVYQNIESGIEADPVSGKLKECGFSLLIRAGVNGEYLAMLRDLATKGPDEYSVALAFLVGLCNWSQEAHFSPSVKRIILETQLASPTGLEAIGHIAHSIRQILSTHARLRNSLSWDIPLKKLDVLLRCFRSADQPAQYDASMLDRSNVDRTVTVVLRQIAQEKNKPFEEVVLALVVLLAGRTTAPQFSAGAMQVIKQTIAGKSVDPEVLAEIRHNIAIDAPADR
jgi:hypothetical protein